MSLLWAVPVVAVAFAAGLVLGRVRTIERVCLDLVVAARRTGELRRPLVDLQTELRRSGPLVDAVWSHWASPDDHAERDGNGAGERTGDGPDGPHDDAGFSGEPGRTER
jgi:hypothetical protein